MLQFYLRAQGLALSWVGTGRFIFSLNYTDADFEAVADRFVAGGARDGDGRLVVAGPGADQPRHPAPHHARDAARAPRPPAGQCGATRPRRRLRPFPAERYSGALW